MIRCRLIGQNIQRSQSPSFHNQLARELNVDLLYQLEEFVTNSCETLQKRTQQLFDNDIDSANITYPYKEQILAVADQISPCAQRVNAANTLIKRNNKIVAFNTDYSGFIAAFQQFECQLPGHVVLIGCGGVGKALCFSLVDLGATQIALYDHDENKMKQLAESLNKEDINTVCLDAANLADYVMNADGVLNCTPVGHYSTPGCPIEQSWLGTQSWVFDAVYTPHETEFLLAAKHRSIPTLSGFELFFYQAHDAFKLFTGVTPTQEQIDAFKQTQLAHLR
ncbi:TPA: saccharopine dehydrogenase NADP-binding domain-containing protein [Vibrio campbellii]|nr:saccharopine dehydrogenase NADP-binding domain-containing protein [Vibrio campbellii]